MTFSQPSRSVRAAPTRSIFLGFTCALALACDAFEPPRFQCVSADASRDVCRGESVEEPSDGGGGRADAQVGDGRDGGAPDPVVDGGPAEPMFRTNLNGVDFAVDDASGVRINSFSLFSVDLETTAQELFVGVENVAANTACRMQVHVRLENGEGDVLLQLGVPVIARPYGAMLEECLGEHDEGIAVNTNLSDETLLRIDEVARVALSITLELRDLEYFADSPQLESADVELADGSTRFRGTFRIGDIPVVTPSAAFFVRDEKGFFRDWAVSASPDFFDVDEVWQFASTDLVRSSPEDVNDYLTFVRFVRAD